MLLPFILAVVAFTHKDVFWYRKRSLLPFSGHLLSLKTCYCGMRDSVKLIELLILQQLENTRPCCMRGFRVGSIPLIHCMCCLCLSAPMVLVARFKATSDSPVHSKNHKSDPSPPPDHEIGLKIMGFSEVICRGGVGRGLAE